jgi:hypothetical protein
MGFRLEYLSFGASILFSAWQFTEVPHSFEMEKARLHVEGVPYSLHHFLGLWDVGSLLGKIVDVDLLSLRRRAVIRIQVAMFNSKVLGKSLDDARPFSKSDAVVKFKAYEFCFRREPADYVSEQDFVPLIWVKDDANEGGD